MGEIENRPHDPSQMRISDADRERLTLEHPAMKRALERLHHPSDDDVLREYAQEREDVRRATAIFAEQEKREFGKAVFEEGRAAERAAIEARLRARGIPEDEIRDMLGVDET